MAKNYNIDDLENYLNGQLSEEDQAAFQDDLETDETLAAEVDFHQDILKGINNGAEQDFRAMVSNVHGKLKTEGFFAEEKAKVVPLQKPQATVRSLRARWVQGLAAAASVAIIVAAMWWVFLQPVTPASVYANAYTTAPDVLSVEVDDRLSETGFGINKAALIGLQNGINAYNSGDYKGARTQLLAFVSDAPEDGLANYAKFYAGLSAMEMGDYLTAASELDVLSTIENFELSNDANWYAGLSGLQIIDVDFAKARLERLQNDAEYGERVREILEDLE